jgi:oligopeptidase B
MKLLSLVLLGVAGLAVTIACADRSPTPPVAEVRAHRLETHGDVRIDDYHWLRERDDPAVLAYLEAENRYTEEVMADTTELRDTLFEEIKGRIEQDDESVPYLLDGYYYNHRFEDGKEYKIHCRRKGSLDAPEEIIVDANRECEGHAFCSVRGLEVSSGTDILTFAVDTVGRRKYTLRFRNLDTGEDLPDEIPEVTGNSAWANDNRTVFYTKQHHETLRAYRVYRHLLGTDPAEDELVFEEADETFTVSVTKTRSKRFILIASEQTMSNEVHFLDADDPMGRFAVIEPRERGLEYSADHLGGHFYIRTNLDAKDFRLMRAPISSPGRASWQEVIPGRDDAFLESFEPFNDFLAVLEWRDGLQHLRIVPWEGTGEHEIAFDDPTYAAWIGDNPEVDTTVLRYGYSSLSTPETIYDYDTATRERTLRKRDQVLGGFDRADYASERLWATARDGVEVPISLVYRRPIAKDGNRPLLLHGYGSYGSTMEPEFKPEIVSLLDRGFVYAVAHIRGGQELGRHWYDDGKLLNKRNTFTDFIDCGRFLVEEGYTSPDRLIGRGGSAGGLLVGAVTNMAPELFAAIVAHVPWVDVVTTMLDDSIPLTTNEFDEWGNPADREYYDYMMSYSPYDNVAAKDYPHLLVTTGLHDSQVQYWEPAKWVARLRTLKTDPNILILKTEMEAGHGGPSGRYKQYREDAFEFAFMLKALQ